MSVADGIVTDSWVCRPINVANDFAAAFHQASVPDTEVSVLVAFRHDRAHRLTPLTDTAAVPVKGTTLVLDTRRGGRGFEDDSLTAPFPERRLAAVGASWGTCARDLMLEDTRLTEFGGANPAIRNESFRGVKADAACLGLLTLVLGGDVLKQQTSVVTPDESLDFDDLATNVLSPSKTESGENVTRVVSPEDELDFTGGPGAGQVPPLSRKFLLLLGRRFRARSSSGTTVVRRRVFRARDVVLGLRRL